MKEFDKSIESYNNFLEKASSDNPFKAFAFNGLGYAYEAKGDHGKACTYFKKIIEEKASPLTQLGYINVGRCFEGIGEKDKAIETYQKFLNTYPDSNYAALARENMNTLKR